MSADTPYDKLRHFTPDTDEVGLDGYKVLHPIGEGGFGRVFLARQPAFGREVAIKVLNATGLEQDTAQRFERECRAVGALSAHPNIVTIYDSGITPMGRPYIVMEHMAGGSVAQRVSAEGRTEPAAAIDIMVKIAGAVAAAHQNGILHRDIKPENVLISSYGEPILGDFGVASIPGAYQTHTGAITASLAHAAPEVMDGAKASPASDVYSLGSTLFTLLAGHPPFESPDAPGLQALIARTMTQPVPDMRARGIPEEICGVAEIALAKDPSQRFARAEDLAAALQQAQESLGLPITPLVAASVALEGLHLVEPPRDEDKTVVRRRSSPAAPPPASPPSPRRTWRAPAAAAAILLALTLTAGGTMATKLRRPATSAATEPAGVAATASPTPVVAADAFERSRELKQPSRREGQRGRHRSAKNGGTIAFAGGPIGGAGGTGAGASAPRSVSSERGGSYASGDGAGSSRPSGGGGGSGGGSGGGGSQNNEPVKPAPPPPADTLLYHLYSDDGSYYFSTSITEVNEKTYSYDHSHREAAVWETGTPKMRRICYGDGRCGGWAYIQKPAGIQTRPLYSFVGPQGDYYTTNKNEIPPQYADRYIYLFGYVQ